ncbi:MAG TPA: hypothetical protein VKS81_01675 [Bacteroidota bacterium]|nr:hypothetical protein [Bacteroidota bacterium]
MKGRFLLSVILAITTLSCHEMLPVRVDPGHVFIGTMTPEYIVTQNENVIQLCIHFENIYEETLQAPALFKGPLTIAVASDTTYKKTLVITGDEISRGQYDPTTNTITADPDSTYTLHVVWNFIDDQGRDVRTLFSFTTDSACGRKIWTGSFIVGGSLQIIDRTDPIIFPYQRFSHYLTDKWVQPSYFCPNVSDAFDCY